ncbi:hypothetical protein KR093_009810 [Drosophila rubida]|uniref:Palmitoyltransferase n=1 Tax=Drosophila rubida TaxID=30044 RepID=A0AAD4PLE3_9MUSC|nr:hypothetical protein KR093_009810 [Drosophila rubida]
MKFRCNPLPRRPEERLTFLLLGLLLPIVFIYEILYLLPEIHEQGSFAYVLNVLMGIFLVVNIEGNLIACMIIDTSVDPKRAKEATNGNGDFKDWKFCNQCNQLAPPRSWHCKLCGVCILRRDHHCMFSGYCVGHQNHRYFICFLFHLTLAALHSTVYYSIYMWRIYGFKSFVYAIKRNMMISCVNLFYSLNIVLLILAFGALAVYLPMMMTGEVSGEHKKGQQKKYNFGLNGNLKTVLGQRMHVVWLFPTIESKLPKDGYTWNEQTEEPQSQNN